MAILGYKNSSFFTRSFGLEEWLKTRGLAGWLEIATDGLEAPGRQRVAHEIAAHYAEAISAHLAAGEPETSAQATALAELGDPQEAALNFQKNHLTAAEAKQLKWMEWLAAKPFFSFWMPVLDIIPFAGFALLCSNSHWDFNVRLFAIPVLVAYVGARLIPRLLGTRPLPRESFLKGLVLSNLIAIVSLSFGYALIMYMPDHDAFAAVLVIYIWGFSLNPMFRIWNKLRKRGDGRADLPPHQTPAC
jgi:hypothetical protein